ncbi:HEAT repeat-containing protein 1 isoform X2 [Sinocyclocheilus rhinocerous]|uniref:HEAT repeat-containing protein 1 isoform X2 n=1 Tax=Sinocyclocheilus rhinocerous TaxID=307959 RepID=UPI0007B7D538|nr:PREDICTED: HEAT repeat-containing protein 1 isoform X2 [Sinocyclocheilus rhinocerous]
MTSLAHQLKRLALPQNDSNLLSRRVVASVLFDPKDAASMDRSTFYALGCTGLEELMGIDPAFSEFQETLFSQASLTLERSVQTKEVNKKLDKSISLFLTRLSPYFLLKPALKCIEWLVHRFHIHLFNQDSLIACVLPYHETKVFVRVIQLLKIEDPTHKWHWLHGLQKPGVPLARGTLLTHCYKDLGFMDFICSLVTDSVKAYSGFVRDGNCPQLRVIFSFYASTIVSALDSVEKITNSIIAKLLPFVQLGLKSNLLDYVAATYMIVCQMAVKVVMEAQLVDSLTVQLCKCLRRTPQLSREGLSCIIILLQNQKEGVVGPKAFGYLCAIPTLVSTLQSIATVHDISPLLRYLLPHLMHSVMAQDDEQQNESLSDRAGLLQSVFQDLQLSSNLENTAAKLLLEEYVSCSSELPSDRISALNQKIQSTVRQFESRYPCALDVALENHAKNVSSDHEKSVLHQFISLTMSCGKYQILPDSDTSLMLSLNHPLPSVRNMAVDYLKEILTSEHNGFDEAFLKDALLERIKDDVPEIVLSALKALQLHMDLMDAEETVSCLISLLHRIKPSADWCSVLKEAVQVLDDPHITEGNPDLKAQISWELLPFLVLTNAAPKCVELQMASCVAESALLSQHPLTHGWAKVLKDVLVKTSPSDVLGVVNQMLTTTLIKNLANMDHATKRSTLQNVCDILSRQGSSVQERAAFVVLSNALLQSLQSMTESQHLHTAQSVYRLLEPLLLQVYTIQPEQTSGEEVNECLPVCVILGEFLQKMISGINAEREQGLLLLSLLRLFITALKCPDSAFKDEPWWNPEKMDANTCCYLHLMFRLFDVVISGASQGPLAPCFRSLMQPLLQVHLNEPITLFKFLSLLWGYNSNLGDQLDCRVSAILQTQALYVGKALLCSQPVKTLNLLASGSSPVVPSLLMCLCSGVCEVRRAAIALLHSLSGVVSSPYYPLVENLLKSSEEIIADPSYLSQALSKVYEEGLILKDKKKKLASIEQLLQCVQLPCCPAYTCKTLLRALQDVHGEPILAVLLPAVERLLEQCAPDSCTFLPDEAYLLQLLLSKFSEASAPLLVKDPRCLEVFIRALGTSAKPYPTMPSFQIIALEQITKPFFTALGDEKIQQKILSVLFDLLVGNKNPACAQTINSVFKVIAVDAELVANELMPVDKQKVTATVQQTRRSKMQTRKTQESSGVVPEENVVSWPRVTLILELLQHKKKLRRAQCLVPALFNLLSRCQEPASAEQENLEYTKQLILSCLLNVCQKLSPDGGPISKDVLEEDKFNVELVVQCVRISDMPQTHHNALLLLGALAGIFPEKVLHNIMPIFTFMGSNIMRLDDTYSFQVINKTVQAVIPALIKANEGGSGQSEGHMETVVSHIVHVFVDALPHVPEHRRLPILSQLMNTLGPSRFLWVLMLLLFKQHATQTSVSATGAEKEAVVERDQEFWISVCCEFEIKEQLTSMIRILQYLMTLPQDREEAPEKKRTRGRSAVKKEETVSDVIFNVEAHSGKDLRHFKFLSVSFMAQLLGSDRFVGKVADCEDLTESTLQALQQNLLEEVLRYIHAVARCVEDNADKSTAKFWRALLSKSYDILDKVNALLPMDSFIMVMRGLMGNQLASVRRKAMELLNNKLQQRMQWVEEQITVLLELIGVLLKIVGRSHGQDTAQEEEELAINRQTALYSLKLLCRNFGSAHQEAFVPVLKKAVELVANKDEEKNVMGSALLCVAEVTSTLKALAIPQLHSLMPAVLDTLKERKDLLNNEIYLLSAVTALQRISETLPHFISPYLEDTISQIARLTLLAKRLTSCPQLSVRLSSLSTTLATKVPPRVLIPTITKCYYTMVDAQQNRLGPLMIILKEHITRMEKDQLNNNQSELTSFFLSALDFRAQHCQVGDLKKTGEIEGYVIDCLLVMVMKLSEVTFRPLFFKLFDWSKMDGASKNRLLTYYRLADSIANKLKGLFVLFAGQLVKPISELLHQLNISHTEKPFFDSDDEEEEDSDDDDDDNVAKSSLLLQHVLDCLHKIFLYDTQRFLSKERADALLGPLVDQLENMLGGDEIYKTHITKHLVPCMAQFAVAMGDDSQWKVLNYQILLKTRHSSPKVRFSALVMLLELACKLRENYMVLLPETIPFLAELMEDECEEVEQQVQKVIHEMETILGEPLQSYF